MPRSWDRPNPQDHAARWIQCRYDGGIRTHEGGRPPHPIINQAP